MSHTTGGMNYKTRERRSGIRVHRASALPRVYRKISQPNAECIVDGPVAIIRAWDSISATWVEYEGYDWVEIEGWGVA